MAVFMWLVHVVGYFVFAFFMAMIHWWCATLLLHKYQRLLPFLPATKPPSAYSRDSYEYGFRFDGVSNDYKCVRIGQPYCNESYHLRRWFIAFLNYDCWKRDPNFPYYEYNDWATPTSVLLHQTANDLVMLVPRNDRAPRSIIAGCLP